MSIQQSKISSPPCTVHQFISVKRLNTSVNIDHGALYSVCSFTADPAQDLTDVYKNKAFTKAWLVYKHDLDAFINSRQLVVVLLDKAGYPLLSLLSFVSISRNRRFRSFKLFHYKYLVYALILQYNHFHAILYFLVKYTQIYAIFIK
jgi:hypothetical protein